MEIRPEDKHCLVCRSRCYIQIGTPQLALDDANASLKNTPGFFKGTYLKAEALYAQGDFELALLYYHRGNKLRPELSEFRIGIQKAREAIDNSIGLKSMKITVPDSLRKNWAAYQQELLDKTHVASGIPGHLTSSMELKLLGELYDDKMYLSELMNDKDFKDYPDEDVGVLVHDGLRYLTTRIDFWKQQYPLYARPKAKKIVPHTTHSQKKPVRAVKV